MADKTLTIGLSRIRWRVNVIKSVEHTWSWTLYSCQNISMKFSTYWIKQVQWNAFKAFKSFRKYTAFLQSCSQELESREAEEIWDECIDKTFLMYRQKQWRIQDLEKEEARWKISVGLNQFLLTRRLRFLGNIYHLIFTTRLECFHIKKISNAFIVNNFSRINAV